MSKKRHIKPQDRITQGEEGEDTTPTEKIDSRALKELRTVDPGSMTGQIRDPQRLGLKYRQVKKKSLREELITAHKEILKKKELTPADKQRLNVIEYTLDRLDRKEKWGV